MKEKPDDFYVMRKQKDWLDRRHLIIMAYLLRFRINESIHTEEVKNCFEKGIRDSVPFSSALSSFMSKCERKYQIMEIVKYFKKKIQRQGNMLSFTSFANDGKYMIKTFCDCE